MFTGCFFPRTRAPRCPSASAARTAPDILISLETVETEEIIPNAITIEAGISHGEIMGEIGDIVSESAGSHSAILPAFSIITLAPTTYWYTNGPKQDFLPRIVDGQVTETSTSEIRKELGGSLKSVLVYKYSRLERKETLTQHVQRMMRTPEGCVGPGCDTSLVYKSPLFMMPRIRRATIEQARVWISPGWRTIAAYQREWRAMVKNLACGNYLPVQSRGVFFGSEGKAESKGVNFTYYPILLNEPDGQWWGMLCDCVWTSDECALEWSLRDMLTVKHSSSVTSVLTYDGGSMLWQNASSMEFYGCHGQYNTVPRSTDSSERSDRARSYDDDHNFLDLIFGPDRGILSLQDQMRSATAQGGTFRVTIEVTDPNLRSLCQMNKDQEMHLDVQVTETNDPRHDSFRKIFIVNQIDVTETVVSQRELEIAHKSLKAKIEKLDDMMDLIETLRWVSEVGRTAGTKGNAAQLIDSVKRRLSGVNRIVTGGDQHLSSVEVNPETFVMDNQEASFLGQGGYGLVFKGRWQEIDVAVKTMILPAEMTGGDKRQAMSLMEVAVSSSLLHANLVKTHSYSIRPIRDQEIRMDPNQLDPNQLPLALRGIDRHLDLIPYPIQQSPSSFQIQIIMDYCDRGNLKEAFEAMHPIGQLANYRAVLDVAIDVAKGMQHLHLCNIIHADLKSKNILLQSSSASKGFVAKIGDFGLSVTKDDAERSSLDSRCGYGTRGHMAPELLNGTGGPSFSSDVYSFGILLFEHYSGAKAFLRFENKYFDEMVVYNAYRPIFPPGTREGYRELAVACWSPDPKDRPTFETIVSTLTKLRADEGGETDCVEFAEIHSASYVDDASHSLSAGHSVASLMDEDVIEEPIQLQRDLTPDDRDFWVGLYEGGWS